MLSKKTKYAIKALMQLARGKEAELVKTQDLAAQAQIPRKFLELILLELKAAGYISSRQGIGGGYYLLKKADEIPLSALIRQLNGPIALLPCASLFYYEACSDCPDEASCGLRSVLMDVRDETLNILNNTTIGDMLRKEAQLLAMQQHSATEDGD